MQKSNLLTLFRLKAFPADVLTTQNVLARIIDMVIQKDEVLNNLSDSMIYRTDLDGSIEIRLNNNGYKIRTCPP